MTTAPVSDTPRASAAIEADLAALARDMARLQAEYDRLIELLANDDSDRADAVEAMHLSVKLDVLKKKRERLQEEHFHATCAEIVTGYQECYEVRLARGRESAEARHEQDEVLKRTEEMRQAAGIKLSDARQARVTAQQQQQHYVETQARRTGYGERLIAAVLADVERLDQVYRLKLKGGG